MKVAELDFSNVDNKTKLETMIQEERAIREENREREMERRADAAEKAARVSTPATHLHQPVTASLLHTACKLIGHCSHSPLLSFAPDYS